MSEILFIKTSSLGDVIHHMPALTEAKRHRPDARFSWVVEEAYAPLVRLHPDVDRVIPVAWRRWRKALLSSGTFGEIAASLRQIRAQPYDAVIDSQGLLRSALIARAARGRRHGYDSHSIRERAASLFYDVRYRVSYAQHAVDRNRIITGLALGYTPQGAPDFGIERARLAGQGAPYCVLLHATARESKEWPLENWIALAKAITAKDIACALPWGTPAERARSETIAAALPNTGVREREPLDAVARLIAGARFVVGVDTGLLHVAAALGVPLVAIFVGSRPALTGPVGNGPMEVLGEHGAPPSLAEVDAAVQRIAG